MINHFEGREILGEITLVIKGKDKNNQKTDLNELKLKEDIIT